MTPDGNGAGRPQRQKKGAHKNGRARTRTARTYAAVAGGAVACTGVAFGVSAPIAEAFSITIPVNSGGSGNSVQVNILEGNVFDPQLGLLTGNSSNNLTGGGIAAGQGNGSGSGSTTGSGNGNVTQIDILSYNIINPQSTLFGNNISKNTTVSNVASGNGNGVNNQAASDNLMGGMLLAGMSGNGNTTQLAFLSGNILNPQFTLFGANISNNTSAVNQSNTNGNGSTQYLSAGYLAGTLFGGMNGNGNTTQVAGGAGNIFNPQLSFGLGNSSQNSTSTNDSSDNGNYSGNGGSSGLFGNTTIFGQSGNGNTSQTSTSSGSIFNDQWNFGIGNLFPVNTPTPAPTQITQQQVVVPTNQSGADSTVTASSVESPVTTPLTVTGPAPADTSGTVTSSSSPASTNSAGSRITTVVNSLSGNLKPGSTALIPTGGGSGTPGHFSLPEPIKKILASIPGMPSAPAASASDSNTSASAGSGTG